MKNVKTKLKIKKKMCEQKSKFGEKYVEQCRRYTKQNIPNSQKIMHLH